MIKIYYANFSIYVLNKGDKLRGIAYQYKSLERKQNNEKKH